MNLGLFFKNLRIEKHQTLHQVAVGANIDATLLSKIERNIRLPTEEQITKLAHYFDISIEKIKVQFIAEKIMKEFGKEESTLKAAELVIESFKNKDNG